MNVGRAYVGQYSQSVQYISKVRIELLEHELEKELEQEIEQEIEQELGLELQQESEKRHMMGAFTLPHYLGEILTLTKWGQESGNLVSFAIAHHFTSR